MAPLYNLRLRKAHFLCLLLLVVIISSCLHIAFSAETENETKPLANIGWSSTRRLLGLQTQTADEDVDDDGDDEEKPITKETTSTPFKKNQTSKLPKPNTTSNSKKNQTKLFKTTIDNSSSTKNKTKLLNPNSSSLTKNKTKLIKPTKDSTKPTIDSTSKPSNSTKIKKLPKDPNKAKNKTTKPITTTDLKSKTPDEKPISQKQKLPHLIDEQEDDLVSDFIDLPSRFQETLLPDLEKISSTSKVYLTKANKKITNRFKPIVGKQYAPAIASVVSCAFILIPLILVSFIFNRIKAYFNMQKLLISIHIYLSVYFSVLCLSGLVTGLEPLRFFYATSATVYVCIQILQTLSYLLYLVLLLMYTILVFSMDTGLGSKLLSLGQAFVGLAIGLHYYLTVFHRVVLHQMPKTSWKVHAIYATCFFLICLLDRAERRKKAYLAEDGSQGKKS